MNGGVLTEKELGMYKGFLLTNLGRLYHKHNIAMQLHIKALRNNSKRMFRALGADTGFDSMNDFAFAPPHRNTAGQGWNSLLRKKARRIFPAVPVPLTPE